MCVRTWDRKTRQIYAVANICMFGSAIPALLAGNLAHQHQAWLDGLRGFLMGMAIAMLVWVIWRKNNCCEERAPGQERPGAQ